jgi:hypothetical protein
MTEVRGVHQQMGNTAIRCMDAVDEGVLVRVGRLRKQLDGLVADLKANGLSDARARHLALETCMAVVHPVGDDE